MTDAADLSARDARRLIGARQLSPVELLAACERRIAAWNPRVNAIVAMDADGARATARAAEAAVMDGAPLPPLHGLPVGIKDLNETAGLRTTFGCAAFKDHVPAKDDPVVARVRAAGAIILAKTNTPEFGAGANTRNAVYGATGNPFAPDLTPAGSSGGAAVALATNMLPLATGSDHGGSLRTPAAYCGVVGFRPSPGVVPQPHGSAVFNPLPVEGPMARCIDDLALLLAAMAGHDAGDPYSRPGGLADFSTGGYGFGPGGALPEVDLSRLRVAVSADLGLAAVDDAVKASFREKIAGCRSLFREVQERDPPLGPADETFDVLRAVQFAAGLAAVVEAHAPRLGPNVLANMERARALTLMDVGRAQRRHAELIRRMASFHQEVDLLICPTAAVRPFPHAQWYPPVIGGRPSRSYYDWITLTSALSATTQPIVCLPAGLDGPAAEGGLPFGLQIVGPRGADAFTLGAAAALERAFAARPGFARPVPAFPG